MIEIQDVSKRYADRTVVDRVSLRVPEGTITAIVGTSGSGKTTLLKMINRLVEPSSGTITIEGQDHRQLPAHELRRRIGYAIQGHGLFPHRTVAQNIATVPDLLGWPKEQTEARVAELLELFQLEPAVFARRYPHELSGGQRQRVGVARALAARPRLMLMDEPFGALDPLVRAKAQSDLLHIQRRLGITILLVTHDMNEAFGLADQIAVMEGGRLLQAGRPEDVLVHPADPLVQTFLGENEQAFRLLSLTDISDLVEPGDAIGDTLSVTTSRRDALAALLWSGKAAAPVTDSRGTVLGRVALERLKQAAQRPQ
ncbi:ABC transporter ATP-binding protein [Rhizobium oryzicola]|uniref:ABC transporter ATP-binding protein n=1 Tax=Rhizobium oryzicola TaxID=1232668 RepID=A0ABT8SQ35_9HYPH|nr:ABC transporter ATP-binding protein [Rhizobium oryzicola]MDO1580516.1 ABC transporter ATP-binding protein [Rhizobium oryzicola]